MARARKKTSYHHGHLREALLEAALALLAEHGPAALSLREVARRAGVSHAAPAHHFEDKAGLLTALAAEGFRRFLAAQRAAAERGGSDPAQRFAWTGWAYVMFAAEQRAYFELMFRPELLRVEDEEFKLASREAYDFLLASAQAAFQGKLSADDLALVATQAWAEAHGLAMLHLHGNLERYVGLSDLDQLARRVFGLAAGDSAAPARAKSRP